VRIYRHLNLEYGCSLEEFGRLTLPQLRWLLAGETGKSTHGGRPMSYPELCELVRKIRSEHGISDS